MNAMLRWLFLALFPNDVLGVKVSTIHLIGQKMTVLIIRIDRLIKIKNK